jgi:hypothetical protein
MNKSSISYKFEESGFESIFKIESNIKPMFKKSFDASQASTAPSEMHLSEIETKFLTGNNTQKSLTCFFGKPNDYAAPGCSKKEVLD